MYMGRAQTKLGPRNMSCHELMNGIHQLQLNLFFPSFREFYIQGLSPWTEEGLSCNFFLHPGLG